MPSLTPVPHQGAFDLNRLAEYNAQLSDATPQQILEWAVLNIPHLYQTTAFGLTGLAATDMLAKVFRKLNGKGAKHETDLIFLDTLYHFQETLDLARKVEKKYGVTLHTYQPSGASTAAEFEAKYGTELWKSDEETYDYLVKVEPAKRAYDELNVAAVITGRRRSQGASRASLQALEVDVNGLLKVNPLLNWSFDQVRDYVDMFAVPYNALLDDGYKSVGDWHSTVKPVAGQDERAGRWADKKEKTECGLHMDHLAMKRKYEKKRREAELAKADQARGDGPVAESEVAIGLLDLNA